MILKQFAEENEVIVRCERIKSHIRAVHEQTVQQYHFFQSFRSERPLNEHLKNMLETFETRKKEHQDRP